LVMGHIRIIDVNGRHITDTPREKRVAVPVQQTLPLPIILPAVGIMDEILVEGTIRFRDRFECAAT